MLIQRMVLSFMQQMMTTVTGTEYGFPATAHLPRASHVTVTTTSDYCT